MKNRQQLKEEAKVNFKNFYWLCVGTTLLLSLIISALTSTAAGFILVGCFTIGLKFFFIELNRGAKNMDVSVAFSDIFTGRKIGGFLWKSLFLFLWSLLFCIPGIIKFYSYAQNEYILADCPEVKATDAIKLSMRMMAGHKWELFVLHLSFIGWVMLSCLTGGILSIFYVNPYMEATLAGYYEEIKQEALRTGAVTADQLAGRAAV